MRGPIGILSGTLVYSWEDPAVLLDAIHLHERGPLLHGSLVLASVDTANFHLYTVNKSIVIVQESKIEEELQKILLPLRSLRITS